ncbi:MAG: methyltransferase [Polyangiales bacterium]
MSDPHARALVALGEALRARGYRFITSTPATHARVFARRAEARDVRDVLGFSLPFRREVLEPALLSLLEQADALDVQPDGRLRARVRVSSLARAPGEDALYVHGAYPTESADAVFFGPDTYRFCAFLARARVPARYVVDIGCGSGAGGLVAAHAGGAARLVLADVNPRALALAAVNAALQGRAVSCVQSDVLAGVDGAPDLIVANPPYMRDHAARAYRDGGGAYGEALSVRIAREALARLAPGGTLLLYTGAPVVDGVDVFHAQLAPLLRGLTHHYEELDPDVFGEELDQPGYEHVERIAAIGVRVLKP